MAEAHLNQSLRRGENKFLIYNGECTDEVSDLGLQPWTRGVNVGRELPVESETLQRIYSPETMLGDLPSSGRSHPQTASLAQHVMSS